MKRFVRGILISMFVGAAFMGYSEKAAPIIMPINTVYAATKLATPTLSTVKSGDGKITFTWKAQSGATYFEVMRKVNGGSWVNLDITKGTSYVDETVESGNTYSYTVKVVSARSSSASILSDYDTTGLTTYFLDQPDVTSIANKYKGVKIQWSEVTGATGYKVYRRYGTQSDYTQVAEITKASKVTWIDKDAPVEGRKYYYIVTAVNDTAESAKETETSIVRVVVTKIKATVKYGQTEARKMLSLINSFRTGGNAWAWDTTSTTKVVYTDLGNLEYDYDLEKIAMKRAAEIVLNYDHIRPNGEDWTTSLSGVTWTYAGENIAKGYSTYEEVFNAFLQTNAKYAGQGQRRNMLGSDFNAVGIGHCIVNNVHYWVQVFAYKKGESDKVKAVDKEKTITFEMSTEDVADNKKLLKKMSAQLIDYAPEAPVWSTTKTSSKKAVLTWEKSGSADGYEIYRSTSKKTGYSLIKTIKKGTTLKYTDKNGLINKKNYYYKIRAYRVVRGKKVYGDYSKVKKIKIKVG
ncbi:MAG: hypothetical protein K6B41_09715 [Butyrivibrio sp.]|nr:hypothetical protein [Butyrivibrio sp.]